MYHKTNSCESSSNCCRIIMWKLYMLGCIFVMIDNFRNADASSLRISRQIWLNKIPEAVVNVATKAGYFAEDHFVTTKDGYVVNIPRIFGGPKSPPAQRKPLVLLLHGMGVSSDAWVMRGPGKDLAYLLVDAGYDVWMLNVRGNVYSRRNIKISPNRPEFWRFSWHENGIYDMPAAIDYMLQKTGLSKVTLIGHSMGTTVSLVLLSILPEYNEKVDLVVSLAPTAIFTPQFRGPLSLVLPIGGEALNSLRRSGVYEVLPYHQFFPRLVEQICIRPEIVDICRQTLLLVSGSRDPKRLDNALMEKILQHFPAGTSVDTVDHYRQIIANASFREFDFGVNGNYIRYGSPIPPEYPLWKVTARNLIYYGLNDDYVKPADVKALVAKLPNVVAARLVPDPSFDHFDFVISKKAKELLYDTVIADINQYRFKEA